MKKPQTNNHKKLLKKAMNVISLMLTFIMSCQITHAAIIFQNDDFATIESTGIILNSDGENLPSANTTIQFGSALNAITWDNTLTRFVFNRSIDISNNQAYNFRVENVVLPALMGNAGSAVGKIVELTGTGTDSLSPGCTGGPACSPGTYSWNGTIWKPLQGSVTTATATKIITIGPTGRDYTTIALGAAYCNTLSGCEMWIDPGTYPVTTSVDLENVKLVGSGTNITKIAVSGAAGVLNVRETSFDDLNIDVGVNAALTGTRGMNVKYNAASSSTLLFNKVNFLVASGKVAIGSSAGTPPVTITTLQNCSESSDAGTLVAVKASSGLNTTSSTFTVIDLISTTPIKLNDWPVTIVGGSNVVNTGNITTIPDRTILVSPGMSINNAIASLVASGGSGVVKLLVGTHTITSPIVINSSNIQLVGEGPGTIIDVPSVGWTGGTGATVGAIQGGADNGTAAVSNVIIQNFKLQVAPDIHGIKVNGGTENKVIDTFVQSTGPKTTTHTGIVFTDSTSSFGERYTATRNIVGSSAGANRWVDGIHFDGDSAATGGIGGLVGYGQGIRDSIISENIVNEAQQTSYVFSRVNASGIFSNRARNIGFSAGSLGLFVTNSADVMVINNTVETNNNATTNGISLYSNVQTSTFIGNAINYGATTNFNIGIDIRAGATSSNNNTIIGNQITGATTGINIGTADFQNSVSGNQFQNVTNRIVDGGTSTKLETLHHEATTNPTVTDDIADGYDIGTLWVNTSTNNTFVLTNSTTGAAVWSKINNDNPSTDLALVDDFLGGVNTTGNLGQLGWSFTNGTYAAVNGVTNHPGIFNLSQANVVARLRLGGNSSDTGVSFSTADNYDMNFVVRPNGGSIANTIKRIGMMDNASGNPPANGIYFEYSTTAGDTTWQCVTRSGGTQTRTNSTITVASGTWANLRVKKNGANVDFYVNGTLRCTNSANIPTTIVVPVIQQQDTVTTAGNDIDVDLFSLSITGMTR
jgi:hypothetical protein